MFAETGDFDGESRKRSRESEENDDKKNRGNYRCSKCNLPKKGHVCPHRLRFKKKDQQVETVSNDVAIQVEMDETMTLRELPLEMQGYPESYIPINRPSLHMGS